MSEESNTYLKVEKEKEEVRLTVAESVLAFIISLFKRGDSK
jgi:hypothetical protein